MDSLVVQAHWCTISYKIITGLVSILKIHLGRNVVGINVYGSANVLL